MIQQWHEFTCSYLWNGMLIGRTRRLKHHRNGGKRSQRWGNIYAAWHTRPFSPPPPSNVKKHVFVHAKCSNSEGCVCLRNGPKGRSTGRWAGVSFNSVLCEAILARMPWSQLCTARTGKCLRATWLRSSWQYLEPIFDTYIQNIPDWKSVPVWMFSLHWCPRCSVKQTAWSVLGKCVKCVNTILTFMSLVTRMCGRYKYNIHENQV